MTITPAAPEPPDSERMRTRVTHGWAFRSLSEGEEARIERYLETGDPEHLKGLSYETIRNGMYKAGER